MNLTVRRLCAREKADFYNIWVENFSDGLTDEYIDFALNSLLKPEFSYVGIYDGEIACIGMAIPCGIGKSNFLYLYSLATKENFRRKGLMTFFLKEMQSLSVKCGFDGTVLVPETADLRRYYADRGFENFTFLKKARLSDLSGKSIKLNEISSAEYARLRDEFGDNILGFFGEYRLLAAREAELSGCRFVSGENGAAAFSCEYDEIKVIELLCEKKDFNAFSAGIASFCGKNKIEATVPRSLDIDGEILPFLMLNKNFDVKKQGCVYANLMLN